MNNSKDDLAKRYLMENLEWYDKKSMWNKKWHNVFTLLGIVSSVSISFVALFIDDFSPARYIVGFLSSITAVATAVKASYRFHERWVEFRLAAEYLRYQKYLYETETMPYKGENKGEILLVNVHSVIEKENKHWKYSELNNKEKLTESKKEQ